VGWWGQGLGAEDGTQQISVRLWEVEQNSERLEGLSELRIAQHETRSTPPAKAADEKQTPARCTPKLEHISDTPTTEATLHWFVLW